MYQIDYDVDDFMDYCRSQQLRPKTLFSYEQTLRIFARYMVDICKVTSASETKEVHIRDYVKYLEFRGKYTVVAQDNSKTSNNPYNRKDTGKPIGKSTINNYLRNIKVFYNYLYQNHLIKTNPVSRVKQLSNHRKPLNYISDEEFFRLIKSFDNSKFHEFRDCTIIYLLFDTGMRISETLSIKLEDVDLAKKTIFLPADNTKGDKNRVVFFSQEMTKNLKRWLAFKDRYRDSDFLFCTNKGNSLHVNNFEKNFRDYAERVGLKNVHPHVLRNNFAKRFLMNGGSIYALSRILGHSSVVVTEKAYLDLNDEDLRQKYIPYSPLEQIKKKNK
jgi:integrase/recombinase XerD